MIGGLVSNWNFDSTIWNIMTQLYTKSAEKYYLFYRLKLPLLKFYTQSLLLN